MTNTNTTTDARVLFGQGVAIAREIIAGVEPSQLTAPTPCDDFDVSELLGHLVHVIDRVAVIGRGDDPFATPLRELHGDDGWVAAFDDAAARAREVWANDEVMTRTIVLPWSQVSGSETLLGYLNEVIVHTWDLAKATGQTLTVPDEVVEAAFGAIQATLPGGERGAFFAEFAKSMPDLGDFAPPFADEVPTASDAPLLDRLVAWNGRRP